MWTRPEPASVVTKSPGRKGRGLAKNPPCLCIGWRATVPARCEHLMYANDFGVKEEGKPFWKRSQNAFNKGKATKKRRPFKSTAAASAPASAYPASSTIAYSISGPYAKAWFTGIVHGVVVQITACAPTSSGAFGASTISNATSICVDTTSSYSTSASASAVFSTGDHITGLAPR